MTMTYVANYLTYGERDMTGWPKFADEGAREWLVERVRTTLLQWQRPMFLDEIVRSVFVLTPRSERPECLRDCAILDAQFAVVHRALLSLNAEHVWRLPATL